MPDPLVGTNPFTMLSLIAAPAVLTNAVSLLVLSTSNRFARAIDRARSLATELKSPEAARDPGSPLRLRQLRRAERRSLLLLNSLRLFYLALGSLAAASLVSVVGAGLAESPHGLGLRVAVAASMLAGGLGVGSLLAGCAVLVRETRLAVSSITEEASIVRARIGELEDSVPPLPPRPR